MAARAAEIPEGRGFNEIASMDAKWAVLARCSLQGRVYLGSTSQDEL